MAKKKTARNQLKGLLVAVGNIIKAIFDVFATVIRAIAYLIRDVFGALEKFAKVIAILILSITGSILILASAFYVFTAAFGLKESPNFQEMRDRIAGLYADEFEEELAEIEREQLEELKEVE